MNFEIGEEVSTMSRNEEDEGELMSRRVECEDQDERDRRVDAVVTSVPDVAGGDNAVAVDFRLFVVDAELGTDGVSFRLRPAEDLKLDFTWRGTFLMAD